MKLNQNEVKIIEDLKLGERGVFELLYREYFSLIDQLVQKNQGNLEDAKELFQETMIVLYKNVRDNKIDNTSIQIGTYIYAIARNLWLNTLKQRKSVGTIEFLDEVNVSPLVYDDLDLEEKNENNQQYESVRIALEKIKDDCKQIILDSYYRKLSLATIAQKMGYSESFIKVKKYRCMEHLKKLVFNA